MASDSAPATEPPIRDKLRLRFRKGGDLRLVSHHDLMRCFERMLRRAALPLRTTEGFHPKPRMVFALSLPLGIVGCDEVVELEFTEVLPVAEVRERLTQQCPPGLEILSAERVPFRTTAQVRRVTYRVPLPPGRTDGLAAKVEALLAAPECWIERTRPEKRRLDLRPYFDQFRITTDALEMDLWVRPSGLARPDEVLGLLGLADVVTDGAVIERTRLELHDETNAPGPGPEPAAPSTPDRKSHEERNAH